MGYGTIAVCILGAVAFAFATRFANVWARTGDVVIVRDESLGISYFASCIDTVVYHHLRPFTFVFGTEGLVTFLNVHASPRSFGNMLARLLVFIRLVPDMFRLDWRLIRVWLRLASAWPIRLRIVRTRAVVVFAVDGTCLNFPEQCSRRSGVEAFVILDLFAVLLGSLFGSEWMFVVRGARSRLHFFVSQGTMRPLFVRMQVAFRTLVLLPLRPSLPSLAILVTK